MLVASAIALGAFMQVLDTTIANVSIPTISGTLGVSTSEGTWVITSFAISNGISVPLTGWLMRRFGVVKTFIAAVGLFTLASFLCGMAWSMTSLIAFRVMQGAVSGPMIPGSQALLLMIFPPHKKGTALTIWSMTTLTAPVFGPVLGGYISDNWTWPWIFFINVPIGAFCALICWRILASQETPTMRVPVDVTGMVLLMIWVAALQIMLDTGKDLGWFESPVITIEAIAAVFFFVVFMIWEFGAQHPIIDLHLFRERNFAVGVPIFCASYAVFFGSSVLMPVWQQTWLGYTASWAGLAAAPAGMIAIILSPLVARLVTRVDARALACAAFAAFAISFFMRASLTQDADLASFVYPMLWQGVGMAAFFVALLQIMFTGIKPQDVPAASGLSNFARIVAGAFSASMVTTLWDHRAGVHQSHLAEVTGISDPRLQQTFGALRGVGIADGQAVSMISRMLNQQAYFLSALDYFWLAAWLSTAMAAAIWFTRRPGPLSPPVAAAE